MFQRQSLYQLCLTAIPAGKRAELNELIVKCANDTTIIRFLINNNAKFSLENLSLACIKGNSKAVKNLFFLAKRNPQIKSALPKCDEMDKNGNTLLYNVLRQFTDEMVNYIQKVYAMAESEFKDNIPAFFANNIHNLQNLQQIIKYLLIENPNKEIKNHNGVSARDLLNKATNLLYIKKDHNPKFIAPLKNMLDDLEQYQTASPRLCTLM